MGRIKEISRKPARNRKRNPVVYLICEGSETEIRYFKRFRSRGCNIDIIPISSQYKSADRLVQKAKATMGNNPYYPDEGDSIWCVFDRDDNSNEVLLRAKQSATKEGYRLAYSNPSFELWFLLHFSNQQTEVEDCQALIRLLKQPGRLPDYEKNRDFFDHAAQLCRGNFEMRTRNRHHLQTKRPPSKIALDERSNIKLYYSGIFNLSSCDSSSSDGKLS